METILRIIGWRDKKTKETIASDLIHLSGAYGVVEFLWQSFFFYFFFFRI